jgi:hypothetical protein
MQVEEFLAKQEIYELACKYSRGLDRLDAGLLRSVFTDDAWCEYGFYNGGADGFVAFAIDALGGHSANQHLVGNVLVEVEGEEAFGEVYFQAYHKVPGAAAGGFEDVFIAGRYLDRYVRRGGEWKIAYRSERNDWASARETRDHYFEQAPDALRGGRRDDMVYDREARRRRYEPGS